MLKHKVKSISQAKPSNASTHGIFTSPVVLRNENNESFLALEREYTEYYSPVGPSERKLIEEMAVSEWRQRRVWSTETAGIDLQMDTDAPALAKAFERIDEPVRIAVAMKNLADNSSFLELMHRYETRFSRQYDRALRRLLDLQSRRHRRPPAPQPHTPFLQNQPSSSPPPAATPSTPPAPAAAERIANHPGGPSQPSAATGSMNQNFAALMLDCAAAGAMETEPVVEKFGIQLTGVDQYARSVVGSAPAA